MTVPWGGSGGEAEVAIGERMQGLGVDNDSFRLYLGIIIGVRCSPPGGHQWLSQRTNGGHGGLLA